MAFATQHLYIHRQVIFIVVFCFCYIHLKLVFYLNPGTVFVSIFRSECRLLKPSHLKENGPSVKRKSRQQIIVKSCPQQFSRVFLSHRPQSRIARCNLLVHIDIFHLFPILLGVRLFIA